MHNRKGACLEEVGACSWGFYLVLGPPPLPLPGCSTTPFHHDVLPQQAYCDGAKQPGPFETSEMSSGSLVKAMKSRYTQLSTTAEFTCRAAGSSWLGAGGTQWDLHGQLLY